MHNRRHDLGQKNDDAFGCRRGCHMGDTLLSQQLYELEHGPDGHRGFPLVGLLGRRLMRK